MFGFILTMFFGVIAICAAVLAIMFTIGLSKEILEDMGIYFSKKNNKGNA